MALRMPGPVKHPKTGMFQLRVRVPPEMRALIGKGEVVKSLGTKDLLTAKRNYVSARAALDARWANLRKGPRRLSEREADELAVPFYDSWLTQNQENPSEQKFWNTDIYDRLWNKVGTFVPDNWLSSNAADWFSALNLQRWCEQQAEGFLSQNGIVVDQVSQLKMAKSIARAMQRASIELSLYVKGSAKSLSIETKYTTSAKQTDFASSDPVRLSSLVDGWALEKRPKEKTAYEWRRVIGQLSSFLGHDDASSICVEDLIRWKTSLVESRKKPKTIRDAQLAPIRAIFRWAVDNGRLKLNPAERVTIAVKLKPGESRRGFTEAEAANVLRAARNAESAVLRWVPWICAYTGARVSEVCQLRKIDVLEIEGIWCFKFDPAAGSLKNQSSERAVPIHSALVESGLLDFVSQLKDGPLFSELPPDKWGNRGGNGTKVIGKWVRKIGLVDTRLAPNHSWRHRLKTVARRYNLANDIVDAISGHSHQSVGDRYGQYDMAALLRELEKLPRIVLDQD